MALAMHQAHMAPEVIGEAVLRENRENCDPPKTEREVIELVNRVLEYHVPPTVTVGANPDGLDEKLQTVEQALANTPKELEWLVENLFPAQSILAIAAMIKTGKTTFILDIVRQLLTGDPWCELPTKKSAVIYLTEQSPMSFNTELQLAGIKGGA